jgi:hypothetical protein
MTLQWRGGTTPQYQGSSGQKWLVCRQTEYAYREQDMHTRNKIAVRRPSRVYEQEGPAFKARIWALKCISIKVTYRVEHFPYIIKAHDNTAPAKGR